jgi:dephospho-CoA kinase
MLTIGITGGLATGKTSVASMFKKKGARVLDADKIVHELLDDPNILKQIAQMFKLIKERRIDRKQLGQIVFYDPRKRKALEKILHPLVRQKMKKALKVLEKKEGIVVLDVPLLFEAQFDRLCDLTIVVKASQVVQLKRAQRRLHITKAEALKRIQAQMPMAQKLRLGDIIIDNNKSFQNTQKQVNKIWQKIHQMKKK